MKAGRVIFGNPHVYIELGNMLIKIPREKVTRIGRQVVVWISGKPLVFEL